MEVGVHQTGNSTLPEPKAREHGRDIISGSTLQFLALMATWLVLSGRFEAKYVVMGGIVGGAFTYFNRNLLHFSGHPVGGGKTSVGALLLTGWRLSRYLPWLLYSIVVANLQVLWVVVHPRLPIDPQLLCFRTQHQSSISQVVLANSITLTPGTITVDLVEGEYTVHALMPASAESLVNAEMQNRVAAVFGEETEPAPEVVWMSEQRGR